MFVSSMHLSLEDPHGNVLRGESGINQDVGVTETAYTS